MSADVMTRPARPEDREPILELLAASFGAGGLVDDPAFWTWKHEGSPFGPSPCRVAEAGGKLVAIRAFLPWRFRTCDRELGALRAVDTATAPAWRGRGLFRRLTLEMIESEPGAAFVFNTPNAFSRPGYLSMGWSKVGRVPVRVRFTRPLGSLPRLLRSGPTDDEGAPLASSAGLEALLEHPDLSALLARPDGTGPRLTTARSAEYLTWRYARIPRLRYDARSDLGGTEGAAVVFRRKLRRGLAELMLAEVLLAHPERSVGTAARLVRETVAEIEPDLVTAVAAAGTPEAAALGRAGLAPVPGIGPVLTARSLDGWEGGPSPLRWANWRCSLGDLELF